MLITSLHQKLYLNAIYVFITKTYVLENLLLFGNEELVSLSLSFRMYAYT